MEENIKKATKVKKHISPVIITLVLVFVISASAFLLGMKAFSSANINTKTEGLSPEGQDLLGDVLAKTMRGLTNIQIAGKTYYKQYCMVCHGEQGKGDGFNAFNLDPRPKDLTVVVKTTSNEALFKAVRDGTIGANGRFQCPPWGRTLGEYKVDVIIAYIHALEKTSSQNTDIHE
ncbi:MAG TPA: c-type cytochrome [Candidatus Wunengus sp. YC65]|uniref:c-type cytochrome n=1 Tax=Candidatus Wunengus sp. YC65 TaxID=3367701 RepID=UPI0040277961